MKAHTSPFKFLDSYDQRDIDIFFGREEETEVLYEALTGVKHLLVVGPSGAGKTSLIECGLRNQFSDADWYALSIRRGENLIESTFDKINEALEEKIELDNETGLPIDEDIDFGAAVDRLLEERFQPVYLLFDQFEELLISGSQQEKQDFFHRLNRLIRFKVPCRVILIMREEFMGHLSEFEEQCPTIFQHRFRLDKMTRSNVQKVLQAILDSPYYHEYFTVHDSSKLAENILHRLPDQQKVIDLSHVQVYLSELWDRSLDRGNFERVPQIDMDLIQESDNLEEVLNSFLKKQLFYLSGEYGDKFPLEVLAALLSERFTKLQLYQEGLIQELKRRNVDIPCPLFPLLEDLETNRILRKLKYGDQIRYEISHDVLALVIGQNLTEEMQLRARARDIYQVYLERPGHYFQEDLDLLRPYLRYLPYPEKLAKRIHESSTYIKEKEVEDIKKIQKQVEKEKALRSQATQHAKKASQRTRIAGLVAGIALIAAVSAAYFYGIANERNVEAQNNLMDAYKAILETAKEKYGATDDDLDEEKKSFKKLQKLFGPIGELSPFQEKVDSIESVKKGHERNIELMVNRIDSLENSLKP